MGRFPEKYNDPRFSQTKRRCCKGVKQDMKSWSPVQIFGLLVIISDPVLCCTFCPSKGHKKCHFLHKPFTGMLDTMNFIGESLRATIFLPYNLAQFDIMICFSL